MGGWVGGGGVEGKRVSNTYKEIYPRRNKYNNNNKQGVELGVHVFLPAMKGGLRAQAPSVGWKDLKKEPLDPNDGSVSENGEK